jgi:hypothetical protein
MITEKKWIFPETLINFKSAKCIMEEWVKSLNDMKCGLIGSVINSKLYIASNGYPSYKLFEIEELDANNIYPVALKYFGQIQNTDIWSQYIGEISNIESAEEFDSKINELINQNEYIQNALAILMYNSKM